MKGEKNIKNPMPLAVLIVPALFLVLAGCTRKAVVPYEPAQFITDPVFLNYCLNATDMEGNPRIDLDGNGIISKAEAEQVAEIYLDNEGGGEATGVRSLAGIEYFTNLRRLGLGNNIVEMLDLKGNPQLTYLNCSDNRLTALDLSHTPLLETLNCGRNDLDALDVSKLPSLKYLYCAGNRMESLAVGGNPNLRELVCGGSPGETNRLKSLDVGACNALTDLTCSGNDITSVSLPEESALVRFDCGANELEELDLSGQGKLYLLRANVNPLAALDLSECPSLVNLECNECELSELDITGSQNLRTLSCKDNSDGMVIYVPAGFDPAGMVHWNIGSATTEVR